MSVLSVGQRIAKNLVLKDEIMSVPQYGMLLCAGLGTRMRPLTNNLPKPLIPFLGDPMILYGLKGLKKFGIAHVGVNGFHLAGQLQDYLQSLDEINTTFVEEKSLLGTGGGAFGIWEALGRPKGPIVVMNGDIVADYRLDEMFVLHRKLEAKVTLLIRPCVAGEGRVRVSSDHRFVTELPAYEGVHRAFAAKEAEKEVTFGGIYIFESAVFERITPGKKSCLIRDCVGPALQDGERIAAFQHETFWADLGTPKRLEEALVLHTLFYNSKIQF